MCNRLAQGACIEGIWLKTDNFKRFLAVKGKVGEAGTIVASGPPGAGKSTILLTTLRQARAEGHVAGFMGLPMGETIQGVRKQLIYTLEDSFRKEGDVGPAWMELPEAKIFIENGDITPLLKKARASGTAGDKLPFLLLDEIQGLFGPPGGPFDFSRERVELLRSLLDQKEIPIVAILVEMPSAPKELRKMLAEAAASTRAKRFQILPESRESFMRWLTEAAVGEDALSPAAADALFEASGGSLGIAEELLQTIEAQDDIASVVERSNVQAAVKRWLVDIKRGRFGLIRVIGTHPGEVDWRAAWDDFTRHRYEWRPHMDQVNDVELPFGPENVSAFFEGQRVPISKAQAEKLHKAAQGTPEGFKKLVEKLPAKLEKVDAATLKILGI